VVVVSNYLNSKPRKAKQNPWEYNVDDFKTVDPEWISHKEVRQMKVPLGEHGGIAAFGNRIFFASESSVKTLSPEGKILAEFALDTTPLCVAADSSHVLVGFRQRFARFSHYGEKIFDFTFASDSTVITSLAFRGDQMIVADAGRRRLYIFQPDSTITEIEGVSGAKNLHGFIIPSSYFDVAVNSSSELWCVNPGMHALQQYDDSGNLVRMWDKASLQIEGFSGCCNPAHFTFLSDGRFVTSEKGMPRIKIYTPDGELESVVAPPSVFTENGKACDVATLGETIAALDFDKKMIRIFEKK